VQKLLTGLGFELGGEDDAGDEEVAVAGNVADSQQPETAASEATSNDRSGRC
jgi:hypothetical protein